MKTYLLYNFKAGASKLTPCYGTQQKATSPQEAVRQMLNERFDAMPRGLRENPPVPYTGKYLVASLDPGDYAVIVTVTTGPSRPDWVIA